MVKIFVDGVLESMTALMLDDYPGHPGNKGDPLFSAAQLNAVCTEADRHGLQIAIHSIGDGGVRRTLDAYEAARNANGPRAFGPVGGNLLLFVLMFLVGWRVFGFIIQG